MWCEFCFGTTMGSGDIEVVVMQGKKCALKHIDTDILVKENTVTKINVIQIKSYCVLFSNLSAVALDSF